MYEYTIIYIYIYIYVYLLHLSLSPSLLDVCIHIDKGNIITYCSVSIRMHMFFTVTSMVLERNSPALGDNDPTALHPYVDTIYPCQCHPQNPSPACHASPSKHRVRPELLQASIAIPAPSETLPQ